MRSIAVSSANVRGRRANSPDFLVDKSAVLETQAAPPEDGRRKDVSEPAPANRRLGLNADGVSHICAKERRTSCAPPSVHLCHERVAICAFAGRDLEVDAIENRLAASGQ